MQTSHETSDLGRRIGYVLKQAQSALRSRMDEALRPLDLTVPQYACLELLGTGPLSNAELARGVFVTAQSMNAGVRSLQERGLITRADPLRRAPGVLWPEQAITAEEALEVFTVNGARAMGLGEETGSLEVGKSADFVVLDRDFVAGPVDEIIDTRVLETWFEGRRVFRTAQS